MKTVVILGADSLGMAVADLLNPREMKLIGLGDTRPESWNVFADAKTGELKEEIEGMPVMPVDLAVSLTPDVVVIAAVEEDRSHALEYMAIRAGFLGDILFIRDLSQAFSIGCSVLRRLCRRLTDLGIQGNVAELGCYKGDISWQLNVLLPGRRLYLFDTFEGFDPRDTALEAQMGGCGAVPGTWSGAKPEKVLERMAAPEDVVIRKGWFPETAVPLEDEQFALVYLDACLYGPTLSGLEFFFPRLSRGGVIVLCGLEDAACPGVSRALQDLENKYGALLLLPLGDLRGSAVIIRP